MYTQVYIKESLCVLSIIPTSVHREMGKKQHYTKSNHFVTGGIKLFSGLGWKSENDNHLLESLSGKYWALPQKHDQNRGVFSPKMITFWSDIKKILRFNWYTGTSHNTLRFAPAITRVYIKAKSVRILSASTPITRLYLHQAVFRLPRRTHPFLCRERVRC